MKSVPLFVRVSPTVRVALKVRAAREDVRVQAVVERALRAYLGLKPLRKEA
jgi:predicted HicB family RNase H-like nuclease